jgi:two-component system sensor histidine kinase CpxA
MRSIRGKILLWSLVTFVLSLVAYRGISHVFERRGPRENDPFWRMNVMVEDEVCRAYQEGGREQLAEHLARLDSYLPGKHLLTDCSGRDLVSGADRSDLLQGDHGRSGPPRLPDGRMIMMGPSRGSPYRFITLVQPWFQPPNILPYYGAIVLVIAGMGSILALHLAKPLRRLRDVVEQFGRGNLEARSRSDRKDEIGELSRAFDEMAERIETLLAAERRLLQDVSHELRSPLARLGFAVELARDDEERDLALARVRKEAERMTTLVGELLQLTRIEGEPQSRARRDVPLAPLLEEIVRGCDLELQARGCQIILRPLPPVVVSGTPELLHRAIENVVRNAIRHTGEGTAIEIELALNGELAVLTIRDQGLGVPEAHLSDIFRPFFRVDNDRSRSSGGVGLGLAIARRAVEVHQGRISAHNASPGLLVMIELPSACRGQHDASIPVSPSSVDRFESSSSIQTV